MLAWINGALESFGNNIRRSLREIINVERSLRGIERGK
jgi:hypothetical protein